MDSCKTWLGFLSAEIIRQCIELCAVQCPGCRDGMISPLLHNHNILNLHEKLRNYMHHVELNLSTLLDTFSVHFGLFTLDRNRFLEIGGAFSHFSTPDAIFYGKYINSENDYAIYGAFDKQPEISTPITEEKPIKGKRKKKQTISQNDIPGSSSPNL